MSCSKTAGTEDVPNRLIESIIRSQLDFDDITEIQTGHWVARADLVGGIIHVKLDGYISFDEAADYYGTSYERGDY